MKVLLLLLQVLQYKKRCGDLEQMMQEKNSEWEKQRVSVSGSASGGDKILVKQPTIIPLPLWCRRAARHQTAGVPTTVAATWRTL